MAQGLGEHRNADRENTQDIESGQFLAPSGEDSGFPCACKVSDSGTVGISSTVASSAVANTAN